MNNEMKNVICPYCGYKMPVKYSPEAESKGVFIRCKGKHCRKVFEIKINK